MRTFLLIIGVINIGAGLVFNVYDNLIVGFAIIVGILLVADKMEAK